MKRSAEVLVVDDNPGDIYLLKRAIAATHPDVEVVTAENAVDCQKLIHRGLRLILLDLNLPQWDGRELLQDLKRDPATRSIPIVVLTSSESARDVAQCMGRYANGYLVKPLHNDRLIELVRCTLDFWLVHHRHVANKQASQGTV